MYFKRCFSLICAIFLITNFAITCGSDEANNSAEYTGDAAEEVSIEAVDEDVPSQKLQNLQFSGGSYRRDAESDALRNPSITTDESTTTAPVAPSTDNSTAVATVYPDIGGSLSNNSSAGNGTSQNATLPNRYQRVKVSCSQLYPEGTNLTTEGGGTVEIVNMTYLLHGVLVTNPTIKARSTPSNCTVVLFYTHWCPWSAKAAPHFNALPRAFRNIRFAAIDSSVHTAINTYFGILSVPSMVLFYNGKILAKFNDTTFNVNQFAEFISTFTDQKPGIRLNVTSSDFVGPISSVMTKGHDWYLYLSWTFIVACFIYFISKTAIWHRILELVQNSWREAEAVASVPPHHFHQD